MSASSIGVGERPTLAGGATESPAMVAFYGDHQAGITTPPQDHLLLATFDVTATTRAELADLLAQWTATAAALTTGQTVPGPVGAAFPPADTGEAVGLGPARLTITLGLGPSLFDDRFGLTERRPAALADLPSFAGDALDPLRSGGDLCLQVCADQAQVAFHAVHNLTRQALGAAALRTLQTGFAQAAGSTGPTGQSPRNLLGFKDGTNNLPSGDGQTMDHVVWVSHDTDQRWMQGGTYLVVRRIQIHLEAWNRTSLMGQEQTIGRHKMSGAPLGALHEHDPVRLGALDSNGLPVIPDNAHIRVAAPSTNHGARFLRRAYNFADGLDPDSGELDAGLLFVCFQKDPRSQFVPVQTRLSTQDALNEYLVHTASGVFACPPGTQPGQSWAENLWK